MKPNDKPTIVGIVKIYKKIFLKGGLSFGPNIILYLTLLGLFIFKAGLTDWNSYLFFSSTFRHSRAENF